MQVDEQLLDRVYPKVTWPMLLWFAPYPLVVVILGLFVYYLPTIPLEAWLITVFAVAGVLGICFMGFYNQAKDRTAIRDEVTEVVDYSYDSTPYAVMYRGFLPGHLSTFRNKGFVRSLVSQLAPFVKGIAISGLAPVTCVTLKPRGEVVIRRRNYERRCKGFQRGHWVEIENLRNSIVSLTQHELKHVLATVAQPKMSEQEQHEIFKRAKEAWRGSGS